MTRKGCLRVVAAAALLPVACASRGNRPEIPDSSPTPAPDDRGIRFAWTAQPVTKQGREFAHVKLTAEVLGYVTWCPGAVEFFWQPRFGMNRETVRFETVHDCDHGPYSYPRLGALNLACDEWRLGVRIYEIGPTGWPDDRPLQQNDVIADVCTPGGRK